MSGTENEDVWRRLYGRQRVREWLRDPPGQLERGYRPRPHKPD